MTIIEQEKIASHCASLFPPATGVDFFSARAREAGYPFDQVERFLEAEMYLQPKQLAASGAARLCDRTDGPTALGYGGARGEANRIGCWRKWGWMIVNGIVDLNAC